jgi:hypothetical protein
MRCERYCSSVENEAYLDKNFLLSLYSICYFRKNPQKSLGAAPTCKVSMARTSANYIGPFSTNSLICMGITRLK